MMDRDGCVSEKEEFEFPNCWNNDVRMGALFAPFRSKSVNPTDWNSKMKFWTDLIESWCKHNKSPVIEISSLKNSFSRKNLLPACLEEVVQHLASTGVIVDKEFFMQPQENWKNWAIKTLVKKPLMWTFNTVKSTLISTNEKEIYYVHIPVVKYLSEELLKMVSASSQRKITNYQHLMKLGFPSEEDLSVVLHLMRNQGSVDICQVNDMTLVKIGKPGGAPVKITKTDLDIYNLEAHVNILEESITKLYSERNAALEKTKQHLAAQMKYLAKTSLRRKKELEKKIEKQSVTLENIQSILDRIEQAKLDSEIFESYQKGISALKEIYKESGLNPENVTNTMDELKEVLNSRNEIDEALAQPIDPSLEENLEDELNELLLKDVPDVPDNELPSPRQKEKNEKIEKIQTKLQALSI